jgi:glutamine---fructose-6-phosphate transaminase (isomerizing)
MLKEIYEQPTVVLQQTLGGRFDGNGRDVLLDLDLDVTAIDRVVVTAAGTASYAGMVGAYLHRGAGAAAGVGRGRERVPLPRPVLTARSLVIAVSQSGETIDTLEAVREARRRGARTLAILNVKGSSMSREVDDVLYVHAGPEIGVASTKAYVAMLAAFAAAERSTSAAAAARSTISAPRRSSRPARPAAGRRSGAGHALAGRRPRGAVQGRAGLPVPRPWRERADGAGGGAQAQGDQLHPRRGVPHR